MFFLWQANWFMNYDREKNELAISRVFVHCQAIVQETRLIWVSHDKISPTFGVARASEKGTVVSNALFPLLHAQKQAISMRRLYK